MTKMLASVNGLREALRVRALKADVIDLKQPELGALGALPVEDVKNIVAHLGEYAVVSATIGDLPMQVESVLPAARAMAATGVDYVKIGFFPGGDWQACIAGLADVARNGQALIAVLFADTKPDFAVIDALHQAGFTGVMLDTMDKKQGSLTQIMAYSELAAFVDRAKQADFLTGLAGSLKAADIETLLPLDADYLGFRGALCREHCRTAQLDEDRIIDVRRRLYSLDIAPPSPHSGGFEKRA